MPFLTKQVTLEDPTVRPHSSGACYTLGETLLQAQLLPGVPGLRRKRPFWFPLALAGCGNPFSLC